MLSYSRLCLLGFVTVLVVVVIVIALADPSTECEGDLMCEGPTSTCVDHYCHCQEDFPQGWQCRRRYLGFQYYRGYGSPYSGVLLIGLFFAICLVCWYPCDPLTPTTTRERKVWVIERGGADARKLKCTHMI